MASVSGAAGESAAAVADDAPTEQEILDWVECMRGEGVDVADPTVDADGNLVLGRGPGGGAGRPGAAAGGPTGAQFVFSAFQKGIETCGQPPRAGGSFTDSDRQGFQDAALALAECMREAGIDFPDPDFSAIGPGGGAAAGGTGGTGAPRGPFGDVDLSDPKVSAAMDTCRSTLGDAFPAGRGGGRATTTTSGN